MSVVPIKNDDDDTLYGQLLTAGYHYSQLCKVASWQFS